MYGVVVAGLALGIGITAVAGGTARISATPRTVTGVPGEPLRVTVTVETERVEPLQLRLPVVSNLVLRAVERIPVQRTRAGRYIQRRVILWQGVASGETTLTNLMAEVGATTNRLPPIAVTIVPVEAAAPPPLPVEEGME
jgi:hypothetical protein